MRAPPLPRSPFFFELLRNLHSEAPVWTMLVVFLLPDCNHDSGFTQGVDEFSSQTLRPKPVVEAFHKTILPRASRLDVKRSD